VNFINLTEFCELVGISQASKISDSVEKIEKELGIKPLAFVEGKTQQGVKFMRPLFTREQAATCAVIRRLLADLNRFNDLKQYFGDRLN